MKFGSVHIKVADASVIVLIAGTMCGAASYSQAATINAASCSLTHVQAAVNASVDGDKVVIPNGSCAWAGGIDTTKQIRIEAQNYTPTPAGTSGPGAKSRNVTITNNSSTALFELTTGNSFSVGLSGIAFLEGTGSGAHFSINGSGSKVALVNDIYMTVKDRAWPAQQPIVWNALGGIAWNLVADGSAASNPTGGVGTVNGGFLIKSPRTWTTASTMGTLDSNGTVNVYIEDSTFINVSQWPDVDDNGRMVMRHCVLDGTWGLTHGFTSNSGGRHFEYYDNTFKVSHNNRNIAGRYFWIRAGTGVFTNNEVQNASNPSQWGSPVQTDIGDNTNPGSYPQARQPGYGHNGTTNISDPIRIWNQTGANAYRWGVQNAWVSTVQLNRDIFVNSGARPGYSKYAYPHPLRGAGSGGGGSGGPASSALLPPSNLRIVQ
jgi:hypothetical protein